MNCMKCGKEIEEGQFFCEECQSFMNANPIRANIVVTIPNRPAPAPAKRRGRRKKYVSAEEQVRSLRGTLRVMVVIWLLTILLFSLAAIYIVRLLDTPAEEPNIGQNYSTVENDPT